MSLAISYSRANFGISAPLVSVETHLSGGLPAFTIVGLPETAVKESRDRVRSAIINSHFEFPSRRITVNLAPADLPKEGSRFDLAIAIGILAAWDKYPPLNWNTTNLLANSRYRVSCAMCRAYSRRCYSTRQRAPSLCRAVMPAKQHCLQAATIYWQTTYWK